MSIKNLISFDSSRIIIIVEIELLFVRVFESDSFVIRLFLILCNSKIMMLTAIRSNACDNKCYSDDLTIVSVKKVNEMNK